MREQLLVMNRLSSIKKWDSLYEFLLNLKEWDIRTFCFYWHSERLPYITTIKVKNNQYQYSISYDWQVIANNIPYQTTKSKEDFENRLKGALLSCGFTKYTNREIEKDVIEIINWEVFD